MVTFNLHGELGNQMFEWATGIAFSKVHQVPVDFCTLPGVTSRMSEFKTSENYKVLQSSLAETKFGIIGRLIRKIPNASKLSRTQKEEGLNFQNLKYRENGKYHGYFQSWRYFQHIRHELIHDFELKAPSEGFAKLLNELPEDFTAIHVRRGGSGAAILSSDYHGLLEAEYYKRAIEVNRCLGGSENYIVFTDNPEKAAETLGMIGLQNFQVIGPRDTFSQCENLHLMMQATSFIGANSSYSWWAAYLNQNLKTQPIFPRQWYMDPNLSNNDMLLPDWISVGFTKFLNEKTSRGFNLE